MHHMYLPRLGKGERKMKENIVCITSKEYSDLLYVKYDYDNVHIDFFDMKKKADALKEEVAMLKDLYLDTICDQWNIENCEIEELTDLTSYRFPFKLKDLKEADISVEYAIDWIRQKKAQFAAEKNEDE